MISEPKSVTFRAKKRYFQSQKALLFGAKKGVNSLSLIELACGDSR